MFHVIIHALTGHAWGFRINLQRSFVLLFHNLCYTDMKMPASQLPESRPDWTAWADFLRQRGLDGLAAWLLEAAGPLTVLGAQFLYLGGPLLRPAVPPTQLNLLAALLEDPEQARSFAAYLRREAGPA